MIALHADWSMHPAKRYYSLARRVDGKWLLKNPALVGDPRSLLGGLLAEGAAVAMGLDLPLGLPRDYAAHCPQPDFPAFLRQSPGRPDFFRVNETLETISHARPFYPTRGVKGMTRLSHAQALGMASAAGLSRQCDRATPWRPAGAPVFWTLGANQSGKAAISAWRDWLGPALAAGAPLSLWPFEGGLHELLRPGRAVLAEVYPAEALRQLGLKMPGSKRVAEDRLALAPALLECLDRLGAVPEAALRAAIQAGFGQDAAGEDRLDCVLGLLCMLQVLDGRREDHVPADPWIRRWEGWVLGQAA